jgi:excisionase family DNA binding protein
VITKKMRQGNFVGDIFNWKVGLRTWTEGQPMAREHTGRRVVIPIPPEELVERFLNAPLRERERDFWTVKQVAALLNKDDSTIRQMVSKGFLSALKVGGTIYVFKPSVVEWLKLTAAAA